MMPQPHTKLLVWAATLWFGSVLLMSLAEFVPYTFHLAGWSILVATAACGPTGWLVLDYVVKRERRLMRDEIKDVARIVMAEQERRDLHSI